MSQIEDLQDQIQTYRLFVRGSVNAKEEDIEILRGRAATNISPLNGSNKDYGRRLASIAASYQRLYELNQSYQSLIELNGSSGGVGSIHLIQQMQNTLDQITRNSNHPDIRQFENSQVEPYRQSNIVLQRLNSDRLQLSATVGSLANSSTRYQKLTLPTPRNSAEAVQAAARSPRRRGGNPSRTSPRSPGEGTPGFVGPSDRRTGPFDTRTGPFDTRTPSSNSSTRAETNAQPTGASAPQVDKTWGVRFRLKSSSPRSTSFSQSELSQRFSEQRRDFREIEQGLSQRDRVRENDERHFGTVPTPNYIPTEAFFPGAAGQLASTAASLGISQYNRDFYLTLLPAMSSAFSTQGVRDVPNAMPGLNFKIIPSIAKHRIPGFQPAYQHMGMDSCMVTLVGCFTGADGEELLFDERTGEVTLESTRRKNLGDRTLFDSYGTIGDDSGLQKIMGKLDAYRNFQEFYQFAVLQGKALEVEINLAKNSPVEVQVGEETFLRNALGNPQFKAMVKSMEVYHARSDRTWYTMTLEVVDFGLASDKVLNLTNQLEEQVKTAQAQQVAAVNKQKEDEIAEFQEQIKEAIESGDVESWRLGDGSTLTKVGRNCSSTGTRRGLQRICEGAEWFVQSQDGSIRELESEEDIQEARSSITNQVTPGEMLAAAAAVAGTTASVFGCIAGGAATTLSIPFTGGTATIPAGVVTAGLCTAAVAGIAGLVSLEEDITNRNLGAGEIAVTAGLGAAPFLGSVPVPVRGLAGQALSTIGRVIVPAGSQRAQAVSSIITQMRSYTGAAFNTTRQVINPQAASRARSGINPPKVPPTSAPPTPALPIVSNPPTQSLSITQEMGEHIAQTGAGARTDIDLTFTRLGNPVTVPRGSALERIRYNPQTGSYAVDFRTPQGTLEPKVLTGDELRSISSSMDIFIQNTVRGVQSGSSAIVPVNRPAPRSPLTARSSQQEIDSAINNRPDLLNPPPLPDPWSP